ncbi:putative recombination initiation defects 3 isoform X2 [Cryptomeria japonica]|uniref:putative recombination initiation defects 3 isoform X2 n=1 Tax=Cryptomeria japonica TaxID=3369 RepID=UPI0025AB8F78|nr:putative recombination initiation defects 3 isoform X2 [Cryptomeria japonica]
MKKLNINKACHGPDLSSISALPAGLDNSRHVNTLRTRLDGRSAPAAQTFNNRHIPPMRSSYPPLNSQSQQSFSQVSQNTLLSQNSQEEIIPNDQWRYGSQERENSLKRTSCFVPFSHGSSRDECSQVLSLARPSSANNMIQRINHGSYPDRISEELEQRLSNVDTALNRVVLVLNSVQSDLQQVNKAVKEVSLQTESIRQTIVVQESTLQQLIKEEEGTKDSLLDNLKNISDRIIEESSKPRLDSISDALQMIPKTMKESLSAVQSEICLTFTKNLQDISQRLKEREKEYESAKQIASQPSETFINVRSQSEHFQKEYHKPSSYNVMHSKILKKPKTKIYQIPKTQPIIENSLRTGKVINHYQPFNNTCARRTWKRENIKDEQDIPCSDKQKLKMSEILINMEDDDEERLLYFMKKEGMARNVHFLDDPCKGPQRQRNPYEEDEEETRKMLKRARRKRRNKDLCNFNFSPDSSSDY